MSEALKLSQSLCAKICHDLAGSIGTIDNCLSLLEGTNESISEQAKKLVYSESKNLIKRIKFFRSIYSISDDDPVHLAIIIKCLEEFFETENIEFISHVNNAEKNIHNQITKAIYCLISIVAEQITIKGEINFYVSEDNQLIKIISNNHNLNLKEESFSILNGDDSIPITVMNCREHYILNLCDVSGYKSMVQKNNNSYEYSIMKK
ncbi:MAG: hypothetical protein EKK61_06420 [Rickettsiales bacterium]|nr:MAG: hypothetical protein EKK61_06420 [Rickettsiales bacterium]